MFNIFVPKVPQKSAEEVKKSLDAQKQVILLDVRTPEEYTKGRINTSINLPVVDVANKIETVIPDKNQEIYVYCLSGSRSVIAVDTMIKKGYSNVFNMTSGLLAWRAKQFPLVN